MNEYNITYIIQSKASWRPILVEFQLKWKKKKKKKVSLVRIGTTRLTTSTPTQSKALLHTPLSLQWSLSMFPTLYCLTLSLNQKFISNFMFWWSIRVSTTVGSMYCARKHKKRRRINLRANFYSNTCEFGLIPKWYAFWEDCGLGWQSQQVILSKVQ